MFVYFFADTSPQRIRHASALIDDSDPDSSTINPSIAMAIAGSPLPHSKANPFTLPSGVSNRLAFRLCRSQCCSIQIRFVFIQFNMSYSLIQCKAVFITFAVIFKVGLEIGRRNMFSSFSLWLLDMFWNVLFWIKLGHCCNSPDTPPEWHVLKRHLSSLDVFFFCLCNTVSCHMVANPWYLKCFGNAEEGLTAFCWDLLY